MRNTIPTVAFLLTAAFISEWSLEATDRVATSGPHVRPAEAEVVEFLKDGTRRSATFRHLIATIERSDVIVYVQLTRRLPRAVAGSLHFATSTRIVRYLRILLNASNHDDQQVWVLAHELQHALEIAQAPEVRTRADFRSFYRRVGISTATNGPYDTVGAQTLGARMRKELLLDASEQARRSREP